MSKDGRALTIAAWIVAATVIDCDGVDLVARI